MTRPASGGCAGLFAVSLVLALLACAVISVAALVDPFSWLPSVGAIFGGCPVEAEGACDLANRYPRFWVHVLVNFAFVVLAGVLLLILIACVGSFRAARQARFDDEGSPQRYVEARDALLGAGVCVAALGLVPIAVALA